MLLRCWAAIAFVATSMTQAWAQCHQWDDRFYSGFSGFDDLVSAACVFDDGSGPALYVAGDFTSAGSVLAQGIARFDGTGWSPLGAPGSGMDGRTQALATFDDGSGPALYAGGYFQTAGGVTALHIAKWNGASWSAVGAPLSGMNSMVFALAIFDDGTGPALYAGGEFTTADGVPASHIAKWNGTNWSAVGAPGGGTNGRIQALATFDDGSGTALYAGGVFTSAGGVPVQNIARWDGVSWSAVGAPGSGTNERIYTLATFDDGGGEALYAGGEFTSAGGVSAQHVARWDGASWSALGASGGGANLAVVTLATFDDGGGEALYAGGLFTSAGGVSALRIARWNGASWSSLGAPGSGTSGFVLTLATFDDGGGEDLYAGGLFTTAGGAQIPNLAQWSGTSWSAVGAPGSGMNERVQALATFDDGSGEALYAGGAFTAAGGVPAQRIAKFDGTRWSAVGAAGGGTNNWVLSLATFDDGGGEALYAGGIFTSAGGVPAAYIARWDGASWSAVGAPGSGAPSSWVNTLAVFDDGGGEALYAGGEFNYVARWDGTSWSAVGAPASFFLGAVYSLAVFDDGGGEALYAGGNFPIAGGVLANFIARWDGTSWSALGAPGSGTDGIVYALATSAAGGEEALYAGGEFANAGGVSTPFVARWDGASWSALGAPVSGPNNFVFALASLDDGSEEALYAGGAFTTAGGGSAPRIARWNGTSWSALGGPGSGANGTVHALATFDDGTDGDRDLYAGGEFTLAGGQPSLYIAGWHGCASVPAPFCFGDGSAAPCPCGNVGLAGHGCNNSGGGGGALLGAVGTMSPDTLVLTQSGELAASLSIFAQGDVRLATPVPFGDGLRCVGGALKRMYAQGAVSGSVSAPGPGNPSITARSAALGDPIGPGDVRFYYVYYRDSDTGFCPSPTGNTFSVGNALRVVW